MNKGVENLQSRCKALLQKTTSAFFAVLLLLLAATASKAQQPDSLSQESVKKIEAIIESEKAKLGIPGISVAIAVNNQLRYSKGFGTSDLENAVAAKATTAYRTASVAKAMTATAVMQLVEQGKLDLDAPIQKYCPVFPEKNQPITARHLLTHQSGIRHYKNRVEAASAEHFSSVVDSLKAFKDDPCLFEPGAKYSYTTYGYGVLGCAIEGASAMKYEDYLAKNIFQPAGMERTGVDDVFAIIPDRARGYLKADISSLLMLSESARKQVKVGSIINAPLHDTSGKIPGGGLVSTAVDLVKFAIAVNTGKLVKQTTLEQMWTEQKAKDDKSTGYGFGWGVSRYSEQRLILHNGNQAGARSDLRFFPDKGIVIAVMTNLSDADIGEMIKGITDAPALYQWKIADEVNPMSEQEAIMKWNNLIHGFFFLLVALLTTSASQTRSPQSATKSRDIEAKVDAYVKPYLDMKAFSGAILIARNGKVLLEKGYGMANYELDVANTVQTKFHLASISKTFTAAAIMMLEERGQLKVNDPLKKYIPDYPNGDKITVHNLLIHTSGIPNVNNFFEYGDWSRYAQTPASLVEKFKNRPLNFEPGARYDYSNSNYDLLAFIIEKVSGKNYGEFIKQNIFEPLGMQDTAHDGNSLTLIKNAASGYTPAGFDGFEKVPYLDWTIKTGNGSIYSTLGDLYKWDRALSTEKLLKRATLDKIFTPQVENVGYGWFLGNRLNRKVTRMSGRSPGFQCEIHRYIDDDVSVIVLGNNYSGAASFMINDIAAIAFDEPYEALAVNKNLKLDAKIMESYLGRFQGGTDFFVPNASLTLENREGHLAMRWSMGGLSWLVPISESRFYDRNFGGTVTLMKNDKGEISRLIYRAAGGDYSANKAK